MTMKPYVGAIVVVRTTSKFNGTDLHPGIVTRVWSDNDPSDAIGLYSCVNIKVLPDCGQPFDQTSTYFFNEPPEPERFPYAAWWPQSPKVNP
jgi:hypothetical protein